MLGAPRAPLAAIFDVNFGGVMTMSAQTMRRVGIVLFVAGILLGLTVAGLSVWANTETAFFGFPHLTNNHLALRCPHFMAWDEVAEVRARVVNTNDHPATLGVKSWVSVPLAWDLQTEHRRLEPNEVWAWSRTIGPENRELRHFIFVSVYTFGGYPMPERQSMCGVYVLPVRGVRGEVLMWVAIVAALLALTLGWWLWRRGRREQGIPPVVGWTMNFFLIVVPLTLASALWLTWMLGLALLVVSVMMAVIVGLTLVMHH